MSDIEPNETGLHDRDVSVDFSVEELVALSQALDLPVLPGLGDDPLGEFDPQTQSVLLESARRSLLARRVVLVDDDGGASVLDAVATMLNIAAAPGILARAQFEVYGRVETRFYASVPDVSIEHAPRLGSVHRLTPFATEELLVRILEFVQLDERPATIRPPFTVTLEGLEACSNHLGADAPPDAENALIASGASSDDAAAFVRALQAKLSSARVTILFRPDETHLEGGEMTWIDAGNQGLWLTPTPDPEVEPEDEDVGDPDVETPPLPPLPVEISSTTAEAISNDLLSYLPGEHGTSAE